MHNILDFDLIDRPLTSFFHASKISMLIKISLPLLLQFDSDGRLMYTLYRRHEIRAFHFNIKSTAMLLIVSSFHSLLFIELVFETTDLSGLYIVFL